MKPTCFAGHEMVLKDEKDSYKCKICKYEKEGRRWWCQSCWDEMEWKRNFCLKCISDKGKHQHIIFKKQYNNHSMNIEQSSFNCNSHFQFAQMVTGL